MRLHERIDEMLSRGASLDLVEQQVIERSPLQSEEKSALWLYAWLAADRRVERGRSMELLTPVGGSGGD